MSAADPLVQARGLTKAFGSGRTATPVLDGVDLTLHEGEVLALLGPNGAGKTTTVRILATLLVPDRGTARVAGHDVVRDAARVREVISLTGQHAAVDAALTGRENLQLMARLWHLPPAARRRRVDDLIGAFDLDHAADRRAGTYSGGMRRRLDLACGLVARPRVMFLDEPTTGLDPRSRQMMWAVIREVVDSGTSIFLTTQYLEEADRLAHHVTLIDHGRVIAEGAPGELKRAVGEAAIDLVFASGTDAARVAALTGLTQAGLAQEGVRPPDSGPAAASGAEASAVALRVPTDGSVEHVRSVLDAVVAADAVPIRWALHAPTLDDVFLALTGRPVARKPHEAGVGGPTSAEGDAA